jgi:hypothetical protein
MKATGAAAAALIAAGLLGGVSSVALAQARAADQNQQRANSPAGAPAPSAGSAAGDDERPDLIAPVFQITSVEVIRSRHGPELDIIRVRGLASSSGWEEAELVPLTRGTPADGMLELIFVARAPAEAMEATGFEPIEAIFPLESGHPYKGVNVHSASDSVTLTQLPGYAEGKPAGEDCSKCVGKVFVPKGAAAPAGKPAAQTVNEERLPATVRVIKHSDGIPSADSNPNRLTIVLSREGTITTAIWD